MRDSNLTDLALFHPYILQIMCVYSILFADDFSVSSSLANSFESKSQLFNRSNNSICSTLWALLDTNLYYLLPYPFILQNCTSK